MKKEAHSAMRGNHRHSSLQGRRQPAGIIQGVGKCLQRMLPAGVAEQRNLMLGQHVIEREAARIICLDVLRPGQPLHQASAAINEPFQFRQRIAAIRVNARAEENLFVSGRKVRHEIVVGHHQRVLVVARTVVPVGGVKRQQHRPIHLARVELVHDEPGDLLVAIRLVHHSGRQTQPAHKQPASKASPKRRGQEIAAALRAHAGNMDVKIPDHGGGLPLAMRLPCSQRLNGGETRKARVHSSAASSDPGSQKRVTSHHRPVPDDDAGEDQLHAPRSHCVPGRVDSSALRLRKSRRPRYCRKERSRMRNPAPQ